MKQNGIEKKRKEEEKNKEKKEVQARFPPWQAEA
jgi:hypothetical protein